MAGVSRSLSTMVSTRWLADTIKAKGHQHLRVLDGSWHMPFTKRNPREEFLVQHIPEAQFFDIDGCCDKSTDLNHMLPAPNVFEDYAGSLGIDNNTHVIVYDNNETFGMLSAQRVWWTFRHFGHDTVSVLDGGLPKWIKDGYEVTDKGTSVDPREFKAKSRPDLVTNFEAVESNLQTNKFLVLDARPKGRFEGTAPEPREGIEPGHMEGARNIPFTSFIDSETKTFKSPEEIQKLFAENHVDLNQPLIATCGSGISACVIALGAFLCGKEDVAVYDGSWTEWYLRAKPHQVVKTPDGHSTQ